MAKNKQYIVILKSGFNLSVEVEEYNPNKKIADYIGCDWIDHTSVFDDLEDKNIDLWLDDEGLLNNKTPVFVFENEKGEITGQLVGNLVFLKHDRKGDTFGLSLEEVESLKQWFKLHDSRQYINTETNQIFEVLVVQPFETLEHRRSIERTKKWFEDNGGTVINV